MSTLSQDLVSKNTDNKSTFLKIMAKIVVFAILLMLLALGITTALLPFFVSVRPVFGTVLRYLGAAITAASLVSGLVLFMASRFKPKSSFASPRFVIALALPFCLGIAAFAFIPKASPPVNVIALYVGIACMLASLSTVVGELLARQWSSLKYTAPVISWLIAAGFLSVVFSFLALNLPVFWAPLLREIGITLLISGVVGLSGELIAYKLEGWFGQESTSDNSGSESNTEPDATRGDKIRKWLGIESFDYLGTIITGLAVIFAKKFILIFILTAPFGAPPIIKYGLDMLGGTFIIATLFGVCVMVIERCYVVLGRNGKELIQNKGIGHLLSVLTWPIAIGATLILIYQQPTLPYAIKMILLPAGITCIAVGAVGMLMMARGTDRRRDGFFSLLFLATGILGIVITCMPLGFNGWAIFIMQTASFVSSGMGLFSLLFDNGLLQKYRPQKAYLDNQKGRIASLVIGFLWSALGGLCLYFVDALPEKIAVSVVFMAIPSICYGLYIVCTYRPYRHGQHVSESKAGGQGKIEKKIHNIKKDIQSDIPIPKTISRELYQKFEGIKRDPYHKNFSQFINFLITEEECLKELAQPLIGLLDKCFAGSSQDKHTLLGNLFDGDDDIWGSIQKNKSQFGFSEWDIKEIYMLLHIFLHIVSSDEHCNHSHALSLGLPTYRLSRGDIPKNMTETQYQAFHTFLNADTDDVKMLNAGKVTAVLKNFLNKEQLKEFQKKRSDYYVGKMHDNQLENLLSLLNTYYLKHPATDHRALLQNLFNNDKQAWQFIEKNKATHGFEKWPIKDIYALLVALYKYVMSKQNGINVTIDRLSVSENDSENPNNFQNESLSEISNSLSVDMKTIGDVTETTTEKSRYFLLN